MLNTETDTAKTIEEAISDDLQQGFLRFRDFSDSFNDMETGIIQLQGQWSSLEKEVAGTTVAFQDADIEKNKIRHGFLLQLENFKKDLSGYIQLNIRQTSSLLKNAADEFDIIKEVLNQRLRGYYEIEGQIGEGNSALVFLLRDIFVKRKAVAKVLRMHTLSDDVKDEVMKVAILKHRNIIKLINESLDQYPFYVICEHINGATLAEAIAITGPRPPAQAADWMAQLADALDYMTQKQITHSNIRPSKIFVDEEQEMVISPFDLIRAGEDDRSLGKFREDCRYMSPELLKADGQNTKGASTSTCSDQFSLGLVGFKILTGQDLFEGASVQEIIQNRAHFFNDKVYRKSKIALVRNNLLREMIEKMLQFSIEDRYKSLHVVYKILVRHSFKEESPNSLLQPSYRRCLAANRNFIKEFYDAFLKKVDPQLSGRFVNIARQQTMLQLAIDILIDLDEKEDLLKSILQSDKHSGLKIEQFEIFVDTLKEKVLLQDQEQIALNPSIAKAWEDMCIRSMAAIKKMIAS